RVDFPKELFPTWALRRRIVVEVARVSDPKARCWVDALASADVDQTVLEREQCRCWLFGFDPTRLGKRRWDRCACLDALHYVSDVVWLYDYWNCVVAVALLGGVHEAVDLGGENIEL